MNLSITAEQPRVVTRDPGERGIKIHGAEGFEGMRKAIGRLLPPRCSDFIRRT